MSYDDCVAKLSRLTNGWELSVYDSTEESTESATEEAGEVSSGYEDPWRTMVFADFKSAIDYLEEVGGDLKPPNYDEEYAKSFDATIKAITKRQGTNGDT